MSVVTGMDWDQVVLYAEVLPFVASPRQAHVAIVLLIDLHHERSLSICGLRPEAFHRVSERVVRDSLYWSEVAMAELEYVQEVFLSWTDDQVSHIQTCRVEQVAAWRRSNR